MKTLYEYLEDTTIGWDDKLDYSDFVYGPGSSGTYLKAITADILEQTIPDSSPITKSESNTLFCQYICGRYKTWLVGDDFIRRFNNILVRTYSEYKYMIDLYHNQEAHLLDKIKVTTDSRFNDTPQDSGTFTDNTHTTNTTHSESSTDGTALIDRLDDIRRKWIDLYQEWADEFKDLFIVPTEE